MFHCLPNIIEIKQKETQKKVTQPESHIGEGGGQDEKWSHFNPFFLESSLS